MKNLFKLALVAGALAATQAASAATFNLSLSAADGSRWYEYYSGVYAELGKAFPNQPDSDGFFLIGTDTPIGTGAEVFANGSNFLNVGTLTYDATTGAITGLTLDFDNYVADNDAISNTGYATTVSGVTGTVSLYNGAVTGINLASNIKFTYDTFFGDKDFNGNFAINGGSFALNVDQAQTLFAPGDYRLKWDVAGTVQNLAVAPAVPEPSTYLLMGAGLLIVGAVARRKIAA